MITKRYEPTDKELRFALDLIKQWYPLYKRADVETQANFIKDIFGYSFEAQRLNKLQSFKQTIRTRKVFIKKLSNGKYIVKVRKVLIRH